MIVRFFRTSARSADVPVRPFILIVFLALFPGCHKKPEAQPATASSAPQAVPTNVTVQSVSEPELTNLPSKRQLTDSAKAARGTSDTITAVTNVLPAVAPKPPRPGQDLFEQG